MSSLSLLLNVFWDEVQVSQSSRSLPTRSLVDQSNCVFLDIVRWSCGCWHHYWHWWKMCFLRRTIRRNSQKSSMSSGSPPGLLQRIWNRTAVSTHPGLMLLVSNSISYFVRKVLRIRVCCLFLIYVYIFKVSQKTGTLYIFISLSLSLDQQSCILRLGAQLNSVHWMLIF